jgi:hypothetical protein
MKFFPSKNRLVSKIEATHNFAIELGIFQSWKKFGKNRENAWRFSVSDRFFRLILVIFFSHTECGKISSEKFFRGRFIKRTK